MRRTEIAPACTAIVAGSPLSYPSHLAGRQDADTQRDSRRESIVRPLLAAILLTAIAFARFASAVEPSARLPIQLPRDLSTPVIVLDFEDVPPNGQPQHDLYLAIYADGKVIVSVAGGEGGKIADRMPQREFQELLRDLFVDRRLLECRTTQLQHDIRSARRERQRPEPGRDAATTVIRIRSSDASHEIRCHALGLTASQLPELLQVRDLFDCQQRLENVAAIIRAGGYDNVNAVLSAANQKMRQQAPRSELMTCRELSLVDLRPDGSRYLQFVRFPNADGLQPVGGFVMVQVYQTPGGEPEITVTADAS